MRKNILPSSILICGTAAALGFSSCAYYDTPIAQGSYYPSGPSYSSNQSFSAGISDNGISTSWFVSTGSPRWAYDTQCYSYFDYTTNCYYDPYLNGYYPRGYRPPIVIGVPYPYGWRPGRSVCPPPRNVCNDRLRNYENRHDSYRHAGYSWANNVQVTTSSHHNTSNRDSSNHNSNYTSNYTQSSNRGITYPNTRPAQYSNTRSNQYTNTRSTQYPNTRTPSTNPYPETNRNTKSDPTDYRTKKPVYEDHHSYDRGKPIVDPPHTPRPVHEDSNSYDRGKPIPQPRVDAPRTPTSPSINNYRQPSTPSRDERNMNRDTNRQSRPSVEPRTNDNSSQRNNPSRESKSDSDRSSKSLFTNR